MRLAITFVALFALARPLAGQDRLDGHWRGYWMRAGDSMLVTLESIATRTRVATVTSLVYALSAKTGPRSSSTVRHLILDTFPKLGPVSVMRSRSAMSVVRRQSSSSTRRYSSGVRMLCCRLSWET